MTLFPHLPCTARRTGAVALALSTTALVVVFSSGTAGAQVAGTGAPDLGRAETFAVLAGAGVTNTGPTTLNGDLGTFPTTTVTGQDSLTINGVNHGGNAFAQEAKSDLQDAYNDARDAGPSRPVAALIDGQVVTAGVHESGSTIGLTGEVTLDGEGDPGAVFVFQAGSALTTASASRIVLVNGAQACNVFWQVGAEATLGTGSDFVGTILAQTSITVTNGVTVRGRVLAIGGAVTLDTNRIDRPPLCAPAVVPDPDPVVPDPDPVVPDPDPVVPDPDPVVPDPDPVVPDPDPVVPDPDPDPDPVVPDPTPEDPTPAVPTPGTAVPVPTTGTPTGTTTALTTTTGLTTTGLTTTGLTTTGLTTTARTQVPGGSSRQVSRVPRGAVPAGDGSSDPGDRGAAASAAAAGWLALLGLTGACVRARRRASAG